VNLDTVQQQRYRVLRPSTSRRNLSAQRSRERELVSREFETKFIFWEDPLASSCLLLLSMTNTYDSASSSKPIAFYFKISMHRGGSYKHSKLTHTYKHIGHGHNECSMTNCPTSSVKISWIESLCPKNFYFMLSNRTEGVGFRSRR